MNTKIDNLKSDPRFNMIKETFEDLFKVKGYRLNETFNNKVWFLNRSLTDKIDNINSISFGRDDIVIQIIDDLRKQTIKKRISNTFQSNMTSFSQDFQVSVSEFIKQLTFTLISSQLSIDNCKENMIHDGSIDQVELLENRIKILEDQLILNESKEKSTVTYQLTRIDSFPEGEYNIKVQLSEFDDNLNFIKYSKNLVSGKKIKIIQAFNRVNLTEMNLNISELTFQDVYLNELNQVELRDYLMNGNKINQKILVVKHVNSHDFKKIEASKKSSLKSPLMEKISKKNTLINKNVSLTPIITKTTNKVVYNMDESEDHLLYNITEVNYKPIDFDFNENSGTKLISFGLSIDRNNDHFGNKQESFLDFLILHTEELMIINNNKISSNYNIAIKIAEEVALKLKMPYNTVNVVLGITLSLSLKMKNVILRRLYTLFKANIELMQHHESIITLISDDYFSEISHKIKYILVNNSSKNKGGCCEGCFIY